MKKRILSYFAMILLVALTACGSQQAVSTTAAVNSGETTKATLSHDVTLLVTSDIHAGVDEGFTLAGLYETRKKYQERGDYTLLIDDGDLI